MADGGRVPRIRRHLGVSVVRGEGVYLLCEHGSAVVTDPLAQRLLPLLDGKHDLDSIATALAPDVPADTVRQAVAQLARSGQVVDVDPDGDEREAGYWESLNLHGDDAHAALESAAVRLTVLGAVDAAEFTAALRTAGLRVSDDAADALDVVLTDDYLRPVLRVFDAEHRAAGVPWLLAKPVGVIASVGPLFVPDGACYQCLEVRLRGHRQAEDYLESRMPERRVASPVVDVAATRLLAAGAVATAAAHWLAGHRHAESDAVLSIDTAGLRTTWHSLAKRPQCPGCGDPAVVTTNMSRPFRPVSRPKVFDTDGGHRARTPEDMLATWGHLVDPVTGVVPALTSIATGLPLVRAYSSGYNRAQRVTSLRALRAGLRAQSCGKGMTDVQARASALGEALERYSAVHHGDEPRVSAAHADLGADAVPPNAVMRFSERQFADRAAINAKGIAFQSVPEPLDERAEIEWTPMWSLTDDRARYVPTSLLFYTYQHDGPVYALADSNGCAAGTSLEDAALQGFYELVERDSVAIWWYNRLRRPAVDLDSLAEPWIDVMRAEYGRLRRELWVLDLTADLGIPAVVALSRRVDKPAEDIILGFGAHHDARIAVLRAISELNQFLPAVAFATEAGTGYRYADPVLSDWWRTARAADLPYLTPDPTVPAVRVAALTLPTSADLADDLTACRDLVRANGMDLLVLDMTRPDIGLPVVKVLVPGLRHFWTRFAPGRLYDVPVRLGWRAAPLAEDQLNPTAMFV
ncbi:MAG TPA: TOMM precursor leader peptide-binding protein [Pseudonocardiaceae bacterium]|nr:TOMM precursor leader peptide-binding protein [Pseudonocardiaceae bacterium]